MVTTKEKKGFTLVELLVVISIIALLLSILMPSLSRARGQAKSVVCRSNVRQWALMFNMYANDNNYSTPMGLTPSQVNGEWNKAGVWFNALRRYHNNNKDILLCPASDARKKTADGTMRGPEVVWGPYDNDWLSDGKGGPSGDYGSYGINEWVCNSVAKDGRLLHMVYARDFWRTVNIPGASEIPLFQDCTFVLARPKHIDRLPEFNGEWVWDPEAEMTRVCVNRHMGYTNMAFLDSSVRSVKLTDLYKLKWHKSFDTRRNIHEGEFPDWMKR